jgi:hypothetical protein
MTTYIALFSLTNAGIGIKAAEDSPRRLDAAKKLLADMGGEMKQFYMVMRICSRSEAICPSAAPTWLPPTRLPDGSPSPAPTDSARCSPRPDPPVSAAWRG